MTKLAVIYYSATGHGTKMAEHVEKFAKAAGAEVRVRHVAEQVDPSGYVNPSGAHFDNLSWPHIEQSVEAHRVRRSARYVS